MQKTATSSSSNKWKPGPPTTGRSAPVFASLYLMPTPCVCVCVCMSVNLYRYYRYGMCVWEPVFLSYIPIYTYTYVCSVTVFINIYIYKSFCVWECVCEPVTEILLIVVVTTSTIDDYRSIVYLFIKMFQMHGEVSSQSISFLPFGVSLSFSVCRTQNGPYRYVCHFPKVETPPHSHR